MVGALGFEEIKMPHQRRPPKRYSSGASQQSPKTAEECYRTGFYCLLYTVDVQFQIRFTQSDLDVLDKLEAILLTGDVDDTVEQYLELSSHTLKVQLDVSHFQYTCKSSDKVLRLLRGMTMEAERSFSALRRLQDMAQINSVSSKTQ
ncbi:hypothetical protein CRENBAI_021346 [Crenichthys baileyi]|uniref:Uncharacterized protein n=1 Tax=Crenichthys baileyi TaxID=28760 RepID=A0AAV9SNV6_9TELE